MAKRVEVYDAGRKSKRPMRYDGLIKHPWYAIIGAAVIGALAGFLFRRKR